MRIAVLGKGGAGKTTVCSNLAKLYRKWGFGVYAVDADPVGGLGAALGISQEQLESVKPIYDMREFIDDSNSDGALYLLSPDVSEASGNFSLSTDGITFLRMASTKTGGSGCYCKENAFLKALLNSLVLKENEVAVLDMCAGIEPLTRGVVQGADLALVVTEPGRKSVDIAMSIRKLSQQLGVKDIRFIGNKVRREKEEVFIKASFPKNELIGAIQYIDGIADRAMGIAKASADLDNPAFEIALDRIVATHPAHNFS